jgi:hypothetical protein
MDKAQASLAVDDYLAKNGWMSGMSVDFIVQNVHIFVPTASAALLPSELRSKVVYWRSTHGPDLSSVPGGSAQPSAQLPASPDSKLIEAVKKAITTVIDGRDIVKHGDGKVNIGVGGLTAELKKGDSTLSAGVSWGGTLSVEADKGDFHFQGELSSTRWQIQLTYPEDASVPDLTTLGKVFGEGEKAMRNIIGATASFKGLGDVGRVKDAISPQIQPVKDAVEAVQGIAKVPLKRVDIGISVGSPDPAPGQDGMPRGVEIKGTITIRF